LRVNLIKFKYTPFLNLKYSSFRLIVQKESFLIFFIYKNKVKNCLAKLIFWFKKATSLQQPQIRKNINKIKKFFFKIARNLKDYIRNKQQ